MAVETKKSGSKSASGLFLRGFGMNQQLETKESFVQSQLPDWFINLLKRFPFTPTRFTSRHKFSLIRSEPQKEGQRHCRQNLGRNQKDPSPAKGKKASERIHRKKTMTQNQKKARRNRTQLFYVLASVSITSGCQLGFGMGPESSPLNGVKRGVKRQSGPLETHQ